MSPGIRVSLLTVSDGVSAGQREDRGGPACEQALAEAGISHTIVSREVLPDDRGRVAFAIRQLADRDHADLVVLTGGTGVAPRDRTPEAVRDVVAFEVPGLAEKMRSETGAAFPPAYLSRQVAGVCQRTLVIALPGSPRGAADCLRAIAGLLPHAVALVRGEAPPHPRPSGVPL
ncbi:MAG: molybdenum cofactor biosynthesis protein B [Thermoanaerobaculia bacterium]|nr:MogA/MoaB family molybdenum cofactor biosynthesis protein [Acidobacteriota bacterium]